MSGTPYGLLTPPMLGQQQGSGLGSLYNQVSAAMPTAQYDMWGRQGMGGQPPPATPNMNAGPGLPQQTAAGGFGTSGYDQWGRMAPQPMGAQQGPQQGPVWGPQSPVDQVFGPASDVLAALAGLPTQRQAQQQVQQGPGGWGQGLLGNAVQGDGSGGGDRGPSQGNAGQELAAEQAGEMAASGDKGPSAGGGSAASGHDQNEEGPF